VPNAFRDAGNEGSSVVRDQVVQVVRSCQTVNQTRSTCNSSLLIEFCPWCGERLPKSRRDEWFGKLEKLGIYDPWSTEVPDKYQTDEWYKEER
jgi:hypothetical protein